MTVPMEALEKPRTTSPTSTATTGEAAKNRQSFFREVGAAIGASAGLVTTLTTLPLTMPPVLFCLSMFGAAAIGGTILGSFAAVAAEIGIRHETHKLCGVEVLTQPNPAAPKIATPKNDNG